jgi:hypothetical protein
MITPAMNSKTSTVWMVDKMRSAHDRGEREHANDQQECDILLHVGRRFGML